MIEVLIPDPNNIIARDNLGDELLLHVLPKGVKREEIRISSVDAVWVVFKPGDTLENAQVADSKWVHFSSVEEAQTVKRMIDLAAGLTPIQ